MSTNVLAQDDGSDPFRSFTSVKGNLLKEGGGGGSIYAHRSDDRLLVKLFTEGMGAERRPVPWTGDKARNLIDVINCEARSRRSTFLELKDRFAIPTAPLGTYEQIDGVTLPKAPEQFYGELRLQNSSSAEVAEHTIQWLIKGRAPALAQAPGDDVTLEQRVELMVEYVRSFRLLWSIGLLYHDFSALNIWWSVAPHPAVYMIDVDGCTPVGTPGMQSPNWHHHASLTAGSLEADRSKLALLLWRVLSRSLQDLPVLDDRPGLLGQVPAEVGPIITHLHQTGADEYLDHLLAALEPLRGHEFKQRRWTWAETQQYARLLLDSSPPSQMYASLIASAQRQLDAEARLEALPPLQRRLRLRHEHPQPGFQWDLLPDSAYTEDHSGDHLHLALTGQWDLIAADIAARGATTLDSIQTRALEYFVHQFGPPNATAGQPSPDGSITVTWSWPLDDLLDCVIICVRAADGTIAQTIVRQRTPASTPAPEVRLRPATNTGATLEIIVLFGFQHHLGSPISLPTAPGLSTRISLHFPASGARSQTSGMPRSAGAWQPPASTAVEELHGTKAPMAPVRIPQVIGDTQRIGVTIPPQPPLPRSDTLIGRMLHRLRHPFRRNRTP